MSTDNYTFTVFTKSFIYTLELTLDDLSVIEQIRKFILIDHEFTIENGMMTPSMKVRRFKVKEKYEESLKNLYS